MQATGERQPTQTPTLGEKQEDRWRARRDKPERRRKTGEDGGGKTKKESAKDGGEKSRVIPSVE
jgi:hypothetical protein